MPFLSKEYYVSIWLKDFYSNLLIEIFINYNQRVILFIFD